MQCYFEDSKIIVIKCKNNNYILNTFNETYLTSLCDYIWIDQIFTLLRYKLFWLWINILKSSARCIFTLSKSQHAKFRLFISFDYIPIITKSDFAINFSLRSKHIYGFTWWFFYIISLSAWCTALLSWKHFWGLQTKIAWLLLFQAQIWFSLAAFCLLK